MPMVNRRNFLVLSAASAGALTLAAPLASRAAGPSSARFRLDLDPDGLYNVQTISLVAGNLLGNFLLERLIYLDEKGNPQPWLAESWEFTDEGKIITFKLRPGKTFHDGTPFNAEAVKFQFDEILDPKNASPAKGIVGPLEKVEAVDDLTAVFTFSKPFAPFMNLVGTVFFAFNSPTAVKAAGSSYGRHPVGTGPFMFSNWIPGTEISMIRFPDFKQFRADAINQGPAYLDSVTMTVILEEGVVASALQTGELQGASLTADAMVPFVQDPQFTIISDSNPKNVMFIEFDYQKAPFDDRAFRDALSYAIDREAVLAAAFGGNGKIALSPLSRGIPGFDDQVANEFGTPYDPDKARQLLDAASWKGDGVRAKDGKSAQFTVRAYADSTTERALAVIQANLASVGIQVDVSTSDWGTFYPGLLKPDWDMDLNRWTWPDPSVMSQLFRSPGHRQLLPSNPKIDDALDSSDVTLDPVKRREFVVAAQKAILEDRMVIPLVTDFPLTVIQKSVENYRFDYLGYLYGGDLKFEG